MERSHSASGTSASWNYSSDSSGAFESLQSLTLSASYLAGSSHLQPREGTLGLHTNLAPCPTRQAAAAFVFYYRFLRASQHGGPRGRTPPSQLCLSWRHLPRAWCLEYALPFSRSTRRLSQSCDRAASLSLGSCLLWFRRLADC